jgi:hypothetical protein
VQPYEGAPRALLFGAQPLRGVVHDLHPTWSLIRHLSLGITDPRSRAEAEASVGGTEPGRVEERGQVGRPVHSAQRLIAERQERQKALPRDRDRYRPSIAGQLKPVEQGEMRPKTLGLATSRSGGARRHRAVTLPLCPALQLALRYRSSVGDRGSPPATP